MSVEKTSAEGVDTAGPITATIVQWRTHLSACVLVYGEQFEHKYWTYDFLVCIVRFIDTGFHEYDRYKHVQSASIV